MAYTDTDTIIKRLGMERAKRLFDRDGDGNLDDEVVALGVAHAESLIHAKLSASYGETRFDVSGSAPDFIRSIATDLVIGHAAQAFPGATAETMQPYALMYRNAKDLLSDLAKDRGARLPESVGGTAMPIRTAESNVDSSDDNDQVWTSKSTF